jgi:hypothetical protein
MTAKKIDANNNKCIMTTQKNLRQNTKKGLHGRALCAYLLVTVTGVAGPCGLGSRKEITFQFSIQQKIPTRSGFILSHRLLLFPYAFK